MDRVLATVMFTDIVGSTRQAADAGDRHWRELLGRHDELTRRQLDRFRGREVKTLGDGFLATFDGPARAIECASAIRDGVRPLGLEVRAGLHTGECELAGDDVRGMAVNIGARIGAIAAANEVLVSGTVKDLVAGASLRSRTAASTSSRACRERGACSPPPREHADRDSGRRHLRRRDPAAAADRRRQSGDHRRLS